MNKKILIIGILSIFLFGNITTGSITVNKDDIKYSNLISPTTTHSLDFNSHRDDGSVYKEVIPVLGWSFNRIWSDPNGEINSNGESFKVGIDRTWNGAVHFGRGFLFFDTSEIPNAAQITWASILCCVNEIEDERSFSVIVQKPISTDYPNRPLRQSDYNKAHYTGNGGSTSTTTYRNQDGSLFFGIVLNEEGRSWINKRGTTTLVLRSDNDIDGIDSGDSEWVSFYSRESDGYGPELTVQYEINHPPNTPNHPSASKTGRNSYNFQTWATDRDGDNVYFKWDWGDGTTSNWCGPYQSGATAGKTHTYNTGGGYSVKVKAKDDPDGDGDHSDGLVSEWSSKISLSKPKQFSNDLVINLLIERVPLFTQLLQTRMTRMFNSL